MSFAEVTSLNTGASLGWELTGQFTPETIIALKQDTGSGGGSRIVPNDIVRPGGGFNPNSPVSPLSPANNIVNFVRPVGGPNVGGGFFQGNGQLLPMVQLYQQGALVFAVRPGGDPGRFDDRLYVGTVKGFSSLAVLRQTMQVQGYPDGDRPVWNANLPKEYQVTAAEARRLLELEAQVNNAQGPDASRLGRLLQREVQALDQKLVGGVNYSLNPGIRSTIRIENQQVPQTYPPGPSAKDQGTVGNAGQPNPAAAKPAVTSDGLTLTANGSTYAVEIRNTQTDGQSRYSVHYRINSQLHEYALQARTPGDARLEVTKAFNEGRLPGLRPQPSSVSTAPPLNLTLNRTSDVDIRNTQAEVKTLKDKKVASEIIDKDIAKIKSEYTGGDINQKINPVGVFNQSDGDTTRQVRLYSVGEGENIKYIAINHGNGADYLIPKGELLDELNYFNEERVANNQPKLDLKGIRHILDKNQYLPIPELIEQVVRPTKNEINNKIHIDIGKGDTGINLNELLQP